MTNGNKNLQYFYLGGFIGILVGIVGTFIYQVSGKLALPTKSNEPHGNENLIVSGAFTKQEEAVMKLERKQQILDPHSLDDLIDASKDTKPIRLYPNGNRKGVPWIEVMEINYPNVMKEFRATLDDTQPVRIDVTETPEGEVSASDLRKWAKESE